MKNSPYDVILPHPSPVGNKFGWLTYKLFRELKDFYFIFLFISCLISNTRIMKYILFIKKTAHSRAPKASVKARASVLV